MARYIDADKMREDWLRNGENEYIYDTNAVLDSIDSQPTADVQEVVRCEKCKHKQELDKYEKRLYIEGCVACTQISPSSDRLVMLPTDFCSYGERK